MSPPSEKPSARAAQLDSALHRVGSFVRSQVDLSRHVMQALREQAINPYPYLRPIIERAAAVREPPISPTPHQVVWTRGPLRLLRYPSPRRRYRTPILFVYSMINRWYILDFLPGRSLIEYLTRAGFEVYAIDWGIAGPHEQHMTWAELLGTTLRGAVRWTLRASGSDTLSLYGYCMGGTLSLAYASLYPQGLGSVVAQATPVDFSQGGIYTLWTQEQHFNVDTLVDAYGNVPTQVLESGFFAAAPVQRFTRWLEVCRRIDDPDFVTTFLAMERWGADAVPFPGEVYRQYIKDCYQHNLFCQGRMQVGGDTIDLRRIHCPLLNLIAEHDTIAPPAMSEPLLNLVSSEVKTTLRFPVGHIGLSASSKSPKQVWPRIAAWLAEQATPIAEGRTE